MHLSVSVHYVHSDINHTSIKPHKNFGSFSVVSQDRVMPGKPLTLLHLWSRVSPNQPCSILRFEDCAAVTMINFPVLIPELTYSTLQYEVVEE